MKINQWAILFLLISTTNVIHLQGQPNDKNKCGTPLPNENEVNQLRHVGNNRYLLSVLKSNGFNLPKDYFDKVDERGLYKGRRLSLDEVRNGRSDDNSGGKVNKGKNTNEMESARGLPPTRYYIPVRVRIFRNNAGAQALTRARLDIIFEEAANIFRENGVPVQFYVQSLLFTTNNTYYNLETALIPQMFGAYHSNNVVNLHFVNTIGGEIGGVTYYITNDIAIQTQGFTNNQIGQTLAHEFGHELHLFHPHAGRVWYTAFPCSGDNEDCSNCTQESVSRNKTQSAVCEAAWPFYIGKKKCEVNGDLLCDTPASPSINGRNTPPIACTFDFDFLNPPVDSKDNWGVWWAPEATNLMSYASFDCARDLTFGQIGVILDNIPNFATTQSGYTINGPSVICPGQATTFSVNIPGTNADNYVWSVPEGWIVTNNGNNVVTISGVNNYNGNTVYVTPYIGEVPTQMTVTVNPMTLNIVGYSEIPDDGIPYNYTVNPTNGATNFQWSVWPGWFIQGSPTTFSASIGASPGAQNAYINVSATACGSTVWGSKYVTIGNGGGPIHFTAEGSIEEIGQVSVFPNPTNGRLFIKNETQEETTFMVYDAVSGKQLLISNLEKGVNHFDLTNFNAGVYLLRFSNGIIKSKKLIVK